ARPIRFVCKDCGADSSDLINQLVRQQLGLDAPGPAGSVPAFAPPPTTEPVIVRVNSAAVKLLSRMAGALGAIPPTATTPSVAATRPAAGPSPLRVAIHTAPAAPPAAATPPTPAARPAASPAPVRVAVHKPAAAAAEAAPSAEAPQLCLKHPGQLTTHRCVVCQKPICPKCMELFGYVCSALCKGKAETQGMQLPIYAN